jgi:outer membrane protein, adhesin transport system
MKMKIRSGLISILFLTIALSLDGQAILGLKDCISQGLEKNFSILVARNNQTISANNYTIGNAGFLPSLDLTGRYNGTRNATIVTATDGTETNNEAVNASSANAGVTLGWTIFNGFNVQRTYKKLNEQKQLGELSTQLAAENLITDIVVAYYGYIQQVQMVKTLEYAVKLSKERLRIDEERYLLRSGSKMQVLQSKVYLNNDSSRLSKQFEVVRAAQIRLNELMAADDLGARFSSKDTMVNVNSQLLYEKLLEETLSKNTSLVIASKNKTISEYDYKIVASRTYPYLNFSTGYSSNLAMYTTGTNKSLMTNGLNYGVTMGFNIFDGFNQRRSLSNSAIDVKNKELKYLELEQGIKADLITLYSAYSNNLRLIKLEEQNLQTASENLDIALERYKLGSLAGIDLREVQKSLLDARERLLLIEAQAKLGEISLLLISGNIMSYYQ